MNLSTATDYSPYFSLITAPEAEWDVFRLSLEVCRIISPRIAFEEYRERVMVWGHEAATLAGRGADVFTLVDAINQVLFKWNSFAGAESDYYNPRNSYMNHVIDQRQGIPITLCILYREVAHLAGLPLDWIAMPGHFLLRLKVPGHNLFLDAYRQGQLLVSEECLQLIRDRQDKATFQPKLSHLDPVGNPAVLLRLLMNLKLIYRKTGDNPRLLAIIEHRLPLLRNDLSERLERGLVKAGVEDYRGALADIEYFLVNSKNEDLNETIEEKLEEIKRLAKGD